MRPQSSWIGGRSPGRSPGQPAGTMQVRVGLRLVDKPLTFMEGTVKQLKSIAIGAALFASAFGCGGDDNNGPLGNVDSLIILQRPKRNDMGDIFQYTSYIPGARLVKLSPPTADGTKTVICCDGAGAEFAGMDIQAYDLSFDAK